MMVKNFFILQLGVKMKKSKRYIKKQNNKPLINKKVLAKVITHLFGYLNPYYRSAYNIPKRRK